MWGGLPVDQQGGKGVTTRIAAVCFDSGDTLVDEATEVRDARGVVVRADLIGGAADTVRAVKALGYPVALVADGFAESFANVLGHAGIWPLFDAVAVSETLGVEKPHPRMFQYALEQLGIDRQDYGHVVMVGNNLGRDVAGANALGLVSVWLDWAPRRSKVPRTALEVPRHVAHTPLEVLDVLAEIEVELSSVKNH